MASQAFTDNLEREEDGRECCDTADVGRDRGLPRVSATSLTHSLMAFLDPGLFCKYAK